MARPISPNRTNITLPLRPDARRALRATSELDGMSMVEVMSRLAETYAAADRAGRQLLLGTLPSSYADDAAKRLVDALVGRIRDAEQSAAGGGIDDVPGRPKVDALLDVRDEPAADPAGSASPRRRARATR